MTPTIRRAGLVALAVLFALPAASFAADHGGAKPNPLDPNFVNSIVTVVVFFSLLAVLYKFAWGPILKGLKTREDAEHRALDEARVAREEAAALKGQVQAELAKAQLQIRELLDEARKDADTLRARERELGVKDAQHERERAQREIGSAKDAALKEIYEKAVGLSELMSAKAIGRSITIEDHQRLLDESLTELSHLAQTTA